MQVNINTFEISPTAVNGGPSLSHLTLSSKQYAVMVDDRRLAEGRIHALEKKPKFRDELAQK